MLSQICLCSQYNIKKKEELVEAAPQEEPNPLMRKKKTPEELAAEAEQEDLDDFTSKYRIYLYLYMHSGIRRTGVLPFIGRHTLLFVQYA